MNIPRKDDNSGVKLMAGVMVLLIAMFLGVCLMVFDLREINKKLKIEITNNQNTIATFILIVNEEWAIARNERTISKNIQINQKEQISLLEESIEGKDKRWARIKRVRDAIDTLTSLPLTIEARTTMARVVVDSSEEFDVPASLILGVIKTESNFNRHAVSHAGAQGLMQLMPRTAMEIKQWLNLKHFNPWLAKDNIRFGSSYLARMFHTFEDNQELAIKAYNCGSTCVMKVEAKEWKDYPKETRDYFPKVIKYQQKFIDKGVAW